MSRSSSKLKTRIGNRSESMTRAQLDPMHRNEDSPRSSNYVPGVEQFHRVGSDRQTWSRSQSARSHDDLHHDHSRKSTVLSRVKEKARRWRKNFLKKKNNQAGDFITPSSSVGLEDDINVAAAAAESYQDEDPEYLGAPMYESELAPECLKEHARQNPRAVPVISEKHVLASSVKQVSESVQTKDRANSSETEKHPTLETHKIITSNDDDDDDDYEETEKHAVRSDDRRPLISPRENKWDKGISVKEYIMQKFEPGEDDKVLSQVISDAMVPTRHHPGDHHVGVMEKMREAVNSLWGIEEPNQSTMRQSDHVNTKPSSNVTYSTNAQTDVMEEENQRRILQTN